MALISVVVPIYNVENYLEDCIQSIVKQTLADIEIILVNDGSQDNSSKICEKYRETDNRITVINKPNGGLSSARNAGLKHATGKYVSFVDADDWIAPDMMELMYEACATTNSQISTCGRFVAHESYSYTQYTLGAPLTLTREETIKRLLTGDSIDVACWDKIFERCLFTNIHFPEGQIHEDMAIIFDIITKVSSCHHVGKPLYHYRQRNLSITKTKFTSRNMTILTHIDHISELLKPNLELEPYVQAFRLRMLKNVATMIISNSEKISASTFPGNALVEIKSELSTNLLAILTSSKISLLDKLSILSIVTNVYTVTKLTYSKLRGLLNMN